jgi:pyruvyltransferase
MASIPLFYWSEIKLAGRSKENYGDLLSKYIVERITEKEVKWVQPKKRSWISRNRKNYLAAGSIIHHANKNSVIWGSGIIDQEQTIAKATFLAVRGPKTRDYLIEQGHNCPMVYGDPAILLPLLYQPTVEKIKKIGIIPHYKDFEMTKALFQGNEKILVIDLLCDDIEKVTLEILSCERTITSSLHGLIISHAYKIPSIWIEFSDKLFGNGIKFIDYLKSVKLKPYNEKLAPEELSLDVIDKLFMKFQALPEDGVMVSLQTQLLKVCPFISNQNLNEISAI